MFSISRWVIPSFILCSSINGNEEISKIVDRITLKHQELEKEILQLRTLIGTSQVALQHLPPIKAENTFSQRIQIRTADAIKFYEYKEFEKAKESFRLAWEEEPSSYLTNYNLGIAYYQLGNKALAKKLFKTALDGNLSFPGSSQIEAILYPDLNQKKESQLTQKEPSTVEMENLAKETETYLKSSKINYTQKMRATITLLNEMLAISKANKNLVRVYYLKIADSFAAFELYSKAIDVLNQYQNLLKDEVLTEQYYTQLLNFEEKKKLQDKEVATLIDNTPSLEIKDKLNRDLNELGVFGTQLDSFVEHLNFDDPDFQKLCERLGDYRWGNKTDKHVLIIDRFQNLLYSSLPGTLPIDRYQDTSGVKFLKNITFLNEQMQLKQTEYFPVDLRVRHDTVPYVIMYTYSPKHQAFIIVRLPKEDLS
jgi:tetratricopeptide (TPR) repeat protein